jgi:signal transduction histidine kinase
MFIFPKNNLTVKLKSAFLILILLSIRLVSYSQGDKSVIDSLFRLSLSKDKNIQLNAYIDISREYWNVEPDSSYFYAHKALDIANKLKDNLSLGDAYNNMGNAFFMHLQFEESLPFYEKAIEYRRRSEDFLKVAYTMNNFGFVYRNLKMYSESINAFKESASLSESIEEFQNQAYMLMNVAEVYSRINDSNKALEYAIQAVSIFIQLELKEGIAYSYNFIGSLHQNLNNTNLALEYHLKAYEIYKKLNSLNGLSTSANNLGIVYDELNDNQKALEFYKKSLELAIKTGSKEGQAVAYNNIGYLNSKIKNYSEALDAYQKSIVLSEEIKEYPSIMNTYNNIAWVYYHNGEINKAEEYVNKALSYSEHNDNLLFTAESHEILSKIFYDKGYYKRGFDELAKFMNIKDSLFKASSNDKFMEMQVRFETERKEKEIELLKKNDEIKNLQLQRQKNFSLFWTLFSVLLFVFAIIFIVNLRAKHNVNKLLTEKNVLLEETNQKLVESEQHLKELNVTKDRFFSLISHDLKNPFSALMGFSELLNSNYGDYTKEEIKDLVKIIYDSSQNLYKLLDNLLQWSRSQLGSIMFNPELFPLHSIINQELELLKPIADKKELRITIRVEEYLIVFADKNLVGVIVRNLLSNAIKFCNQNDRIIISANDFDNKVEITVSDTGIGINEEDQEKLFRLDTTFTSIGTADEKGTGLGLILCKEFVEKNGGTIKVSSNEDKGSTFTFTLPSIRSSHKA